MENLERVLREHPFLADLSEEHVHFMVGCAKNLVFKPDEFVIREGALVEHLYLVREGRLALEVHSPGRGVVAAETLREGDVVGWSSLFPPYRFHLDVRALERTRVIAFDGGCLGGKLEEDPRLGYMLLKRLIFLVDQRLQRVRMQSLDVYGGA